jgi:hypothetical protein
LTWIFLSLLSEEKMFCKKLTKVNKNWIELTCTTKRITEIRNSVKVLFWNSEKFRGIQGQFRRKEKIQTEVKKIPADFRTDGIPWTP